MSGQGALFDGWDPSLVKPAALWEPLTDEDVGLDEQARWIWPDRVDGPQLVTDTDGPAVVSGGAW